MTAWLLVIFLMTSSGKVETQYIDSYDTQKQCMAVGEAEGKKVIHTLDTTKHDYVEMKGLCVPAQHGMSVPGKPA